MRRDLALDAELPAKLGHDVLHRSRTDGRARLAHFVPTAEGRQTTRAAYLVLAELPVQRDRLGRLGVEVYCTALATLRAVDVRRAIDQIDVAPPESAQLGNPHPRPEE